MRLPLLSLPLLSLGLLLSLPLPAQSPLASEPFDYADQNGMFNLAGGSSLGWAGPWVRETGDDGIIERGDLTTDVISGDAGGTHARLEFVRAGIRYNRRLNLIADRGQELWVTAVLHWDETAAVNNVGNVTFLRAGQQVISFGRKFGNERIAIILPGGANFETDVIAEGTHHLLLKLEMSGDAGAEMAYLWVDPDFQQPLAGPDVSTADVAVPVGRLRINGGIDQLQLKVEGTPPLLMGFDDFAIGTSFVSVLPEFTTSVRAVGEADVPLNVYPNPTQDHLTIRWRQPLPGPVDLQLYDKLGQLVWQVQGMNFASGEQQLWVDLGKWNLPAGAYTLRLAGTGFRGAQRVVIGG